MSFEYEKYQAPKPPRFALRTDVRADNNIDLSLSESIAESNKAALSGATPKGGFDAALADTLLANEANKAAEQASQKPATQAKQTAANNTQIASFASKGTVDVNGKMIDPIQQQLQTQQKLLMKNGAKMMGTRQIYAMMAAIGDFLPRELRKKMEFTKSRFNYEKKSDDVEQVELDDAFETDYGDLAEQDSQAKEIFSSQFFEQVEKEIPGEGNTVPHNLAFGPDLFKEGDEVNQKLFDENPYLNGLKQYSMSHRHILEKLQPGFFEKVKQWKQEMARGKTFVEGVTDVYQDTDIEEFNIYHNYYDEIMTREFNDYSRTDSAFFAANMTESITGFNSVLRELFGSAKEMMPKQTGVDEFGNPVFEELSDEQIEDILKKKEKKIDEWYAKVGKHLDVGMLYPYGLFFASAPATAAMMDLGETMRGSGREQNVFQDKIITDLSKYIYDEFIFENFKLQEPLTKENFVIDEVGRSERIYDSLVESGYLDAFGRVGEAFDPKNPDLAVGIPLSQWEEERVIQILRERSFGKFSFIAQDQMKVNGKRRLNMQLMGSDGVSRTLPEIIDLINTGRNAKERMANIETAYNYSLNMVKSIYQLDSNGTWKAPTLSAQKVDNHYELTVYGDATWEEYQSGDTVGYQPVESQALTLQFESLKERQDFVDSIRQLHSMTEMLVMPFAQQGLNGKPLEILIDNSGSMDSVDLIQEGDAQYKLSVDVMYTSSVMNDKIMTKASQYMANKVFPDIQADMFQKRTVNAIQRFRNRRKWTEWHTGKEEHDAEQYQKLQAKVEESHRKWYEKQHKKEQKKIEQQALQAKNAQKAKEAEQKKRTAQARRRRNSSQSS